MEKQLLIYESVVPISIDRHREWSVTQGDVFPFAQDLNSCPIMSTEFLQAAQDMPIIFGKHDGGFTPMCALAFEQGKPGYMDKDGKWKGRYVPAFIRRYPFVFAKHGDGDDFALCIDEKYSGFDETGKTGDRLFDGDEPSDFLNTQKELAKNYEVESRRTNVLCELLEQHNLFDPMSAQVSMPDGSKRALTGFHVISKERLKALPDDVVKDMFDRDVIELIYIHLMSMRNMELLRDLAS